MLIVHCPKQTASVACLLALHTAQGNAELLIRSGVCTECDSRSNKPMHALRNCSVRLLLRSGFQHCTAACHLAGLCAETCQKHSICQKIQHVATGKTVLHTCNNSSQPDQAHSILKKHTMNAVHPALQAACWTCAGQCSTQKKSDIDTHYVQVSHMARALTRQAMQYTEAER